MLHMNDLPICVADGQLLFHLTLQSLGTVFQLMLSVPTFLASLRNIPSFPLPK